jgi:phage recombination protein Bet
MTTANNIVPLAQVPARIAMPDSARLRGITPVEWRVLTDTTFPGAKTAEAILMAWDYCKARHLDPFKRMIHIVPMWSSEKQREVETVWPGVAEIQTTAARTGQWAGMDSPKWGPVVVSHFRGRKKTRDGWRDHEVTVRHPEWCEVTVYRLVGGQPRAFSEPVWWLEAYSTTGGRDSDLPTEMWIARPRGQLHKCAKAASLRAAFPEEGGPTAEEMAGREIDAGGRVIDGEATEIEPEPPKAADPVGTPRTMVKLPGGDIKWVERTWEGANLALDLVERHAPGAVALNNELLDRIAALIPELADRVSAIRTAAAQALAPATAEPPADEPFWPDDRPAYDTETGEIVEPDPVSRQMAVRRGGVPTDDESTLPPD